MRTRGAAFGTTRKIRRAGLGSPPEGRLRGCPKLRLAPLEGVALHLRIGFAAFVPTPPFRLLLTKPARPDGQQKKVENHEHDHQQIDQAQLRCKIENGVEHSVAPDCGAVPDVPGGSKLYPDVITARRSASSWQSLSTDETMPCNGLMRRKCVSGPLRDGVNPPTRVSVVLLAAADPAGGAFGCERPRTGYRTLPDTAGRPCRKCGCHG